MKVHVVFDCVVCLQGAARESGPAGACFRLMSEGHITVYASHATLAEIVDVLHRPKVRQRFKTLTPERVGAFLRELRSSVVLVDAVPQVFNFPRDPDDQAYVDLALAAGAKYLLTWDKDLLDLMEENPAGAAFRSDFPNLHIVTPPAFLREIASVSSAPGQPEEAPDPPTG